MTFSLRSSVCHILQQETIALTLSLQLGKPAVLLVIAKCIIVQTQRKLFSNTCMKASRVGELCPQFGSSEFINVIFQK